MKKLLLTMTMKDGKALGLRPATLDTALDLFRDASEADDMASVVLKSEETIEPGNISAHAPVANPAA